jgi:dihydrofolate synthase/folylpolyglutamate synthase
MASSPAPAATRDLADAEEWLLSLELFGMRFGLDRMRALMATLGGPNKAFRAIHVVGTNGKSSTTRMIAALLAHHGIRTGAYLSPHLVSFAERIRIDGADVSAERFAASASRARAAAEVVDRELGAGGGVTQFEALTAVAYARLAESHVEVAVVEAGLGGRSDATNVIDAEIAVLTNVGLEHTRWLGTTVAEIARAKLAVLAPGATLVLGSDLHPDADREATDAAERQGATILRAPREPLGQAHDAGAFGDGTAGGASAPLALLARGTFQRRNFAVACTAATAYLGSLDDAAVRAVAASTEVPGRFEVVADAAGGALVLDGAHNAGGIDALVESLPAFLAGRPLVAVVSVLEDKDARAMLGRLLAVCSGVVFTACANPRAIPADRLDELAGDLGPGVLRATEPDPRAALETARGLAGLGGVVLATGSIYLVADLKRPIGAPRGSTL